MSEQHAPGRLVTGSHVKSYIQDSVFYIKQSTIRGTNPRPNCIHMSPVQALPLPLGLSTGGGQSGTDLKQWS